MSSLKNTIQKKPVIFIFIWSLVIILLATALCLYIDRSIKDAEKKDREERHVKYEDEKAEVTDGYAMETVYVGEKFLSKEVFKYPFKKSEEYIKNADYITMIGEENAEIIAKNAKKALTSLLNVQYKTISPELYYEEASVYNSYNTGISHYTDDEITEEAANLKGITELFADKIIQNGLTMEAEVRSDKCLVYSDYRKVIVRLQAIITVYESSDTDKVAQFFGKDLINIGEPFSVIFEFEMVPEMYGYWMNSDMYEFSKASVGWMLP